MKGGAQAALAIAVGYILGRRRKMRAATVLAVATASGGLGGLGRTALRRGVKMLDNTEMFNKVAPQLGDIADTVRGDLLDAGKAAAMAAVTGRIESLTDNLHERAETLRDPAGAAAGAGEAAAGAGEAVTGRLRRRRPADEDAEDYDEQDLPEDVGEPEDDEPEDDEREAGPARRRPARRSPVARAGR